MKKKLATLLLLGAICGCEKKEIGNQSENPGPANPAVQPGPDKANPTTPNTDNGILKNNMPASGNVPVTQPPAVDATNTASGDATDSVKMMSDNFAATAKDYYDQVSQDIKDKSFNEADNRMAKLVAMRDRLSADWQAKIDALQLSLINAKKG